MVIYVDGSCNGNGKAVNSGGFGVVVLDNNENIIYTYSERCENTTNNREELKAILLWDTGRYRPHRAELFVSVLGVPTRVCR